MLKILIELKNINLKERLKYELLKCEIKHFINFLFLL